MSRDGGVESDGDGAGGEVFEGMGGIVARSVVEVGNAGWNG